MTDPLSHFIAACRVEIKRAPDAADRVVAIAPLMAGLAATAAAHLGPEHRRSDPDIRSRALPTAAVDPAWPPDDKRGDPGTGHSALPHGSSFASSRPSDVRTVHSEFLCAHMCSRQPG
jgi:hypothetical protein